LVFLIHTELRCTVNHTSDLMDKLTLAKADREYTAWQVAALMGN